MAASAMTVPGGKMLAAPASKVHGGVNVEAQLLGTRGEVGYVVTDSASGTTQAIVDRIRALPETISLRVIF